MESGAHEQQGQHRQVLHDQIIAHGWMEPGVVSYASQRSHKIAQRRQVGPGRLDEAITSNGHAKVTPHHAAMADARPAAAHKGRADEIGKLVGAEGRGLNAPSRAPQSGPHEPVAIQAGSAIQPHASEPNHTGPSLRGGFQNGRGTFRGAYIGRGQRGHNRIFRGHAPVPRPMATAGPEDATNVPIASTSSAVPVTAVSLIPARESEPHTGPTTIQARDSGRGGRQNTAVRGPYRGNYGRARGVPFTRGRGVPPQDRQYHSLHGGLNQSDNPPLSTRGPRIDPEYQRSPSAQAVAPGTAAPARPTRQLYDAQIGYRPPRALPVRIDAVDSHSAIVTVPKAPGEQVATAAVTMPAQLQEAVSSVGTGRNGTSSRNNHDNSSSPKLLARQQPGIIATGVDVRKVARLKDEERASRTRDESKPTRPREAALDLSANGHEASRNPAERGIQQIGGLTQNIRPAGDRSTTALNSEAATRVNMLWGDRSHQAGQDRIQSAAWPDGVNANGASVLQPREDRIRQGYAGERSDLPVGADRTNSAPSAGNHDTRMALRGDDVLALVKASYAKLEMLEREVANLANGLQTTVDTDKSSAFDVHAWLKLFADSRR